MAINIPRIFLLGGIFFISNYSSCKKGGICTEETYSFEIFVKAVPDFDSIFINDTIWMEINEPVLLKDRISMQNINYSGAVNLGSAIAIDELLGNTQRADAVSAFRYVLKYGIEVNSINPLLIKEFKFQESNGRYFFKWGLIPQRRGVFRVGFSDASNVYRINTECPKAFFKIYFKETNQHLYYNMWNFGVSPQLPNATYCFKVN